MPREKSDKTTTHNRVGRHDKVAPQGSVIEPHGERLDNGKPNLMPTAGYDGHYPVQFSDESDAMFASRVAMFEDSLATAQQIQDGGVTYEGAMEALDAKYEADKATLETQRDAHQLRSKSDKPKKSVI
jgi:hypothetical protein